MDHRNSKLKQSLGRFLTVMGDLMILNLVFILCCVPIVTIGPAFCALLSTTLKLAKDECSGTVKTFFDGLRDNFKNGLILSLITAAAGIIVLVDVNYALTLSDTAFRMLFLVVSGICGAIALTYTVYAFPLQVRFTNTIRGIVRNSFLLAFCFPVSTLLLWLIAASPVLFALALTFEELIQIAWIYLLFGISLPAYIASIVLNRVFERSQKKTEQ